MTVNVIVVVNPTTIANGRRRPPVELAASKAGSTGNTHGVNPVAAPASSAKARSNSINR